MSPHRKREGPDWISLAEHEAPWVDPDHPFHVAAWSFEETPTLSVRIHPGFEVTVAMTPGFEIAYGDVTKRLAAGDVCLLAMWEPHAVRFTEPCRVLSFELFPEVLEAALESGLPLLSMFTVAPSERPSVVSRETRRFVRRLSLEVIRECEEQRPGHLVICRSQLLCLLIALWREWEPPASLQMHVSTSDIGRIRPAIDLAHAKPLRQVTPKEAAEACGLSLSRFHRVFLHAMGLSYGDFGRRARLGVAARLLLNTDLPVDRVAQESGFSDRSHLYHRFVEHYGMSPAEYRTQAERNGRGASERSVRHGG